MPRLIETLLVAARCKEVAQDHREPRPLLSPREIPHDLGEVGIGPLAAAGLRGTRAREDPGLAAGQRKVIDDPVRERDHRNPVEVGESDVGEPPSAAGRGRTSPLRRRPCSASSRAGSRRGGPALPGTVQQELAIAGHRCSSRGTAGRPPRRTRGGPRTRSRSRTASSAAARLDPRKIRRDTSDRYSSLLRKSEPKRGMGEREELGNRIQDLGRGEGTDLERRASSPGRKS